MLCGAVITIFSNNLRNPVPMERSETFIVLLRYNKGLFYCLWNRILLRFFVRFRILYSDIFIYFVSDFSFPELLI